VDCDVAQLPDLCLAVCLVNVGLIIKRGRKCTTFECGNLTMQKIGPRRSIWRPEMWQKGDDGYRIQKDTVDNRDKKSRGRIDRQEASSEPERCDELGVG